jgi:hypothetical protein
MGEIMKHIILILSSLITFKSFAEVDTTDLALPDVAIESPSLNIEGQYHEKEVVAPVETKKEEKKVVYQAPRKPLSPSERMRLMREKLEIRNRIMVEKKMEQIRWQQEIALAKKLEQSMNQTINAIDIK